MIERKGTAASVVTALFIMTLTLLPFSAMANATTYYVATNGSDTAPYDTWARAATSIQTAIDAAGDGDTILVGSSGGHGTGVYSGNLVVSKQLTIRSENGFGATTVAAADSGVHVFRLTADNVTIEGFSIYGAAQGTAGIFLDNVNGCTVANNRCGWDGSHLNSRGIHLFSSGNCAVSGNTACYNNGEGILLESSAGNTVSSNVTSSNVADGIGVVSSTENNFIGNTSSNNGLDGFHIVPTSKGNTFNHNVASDNGNNGFLLFSSTDNILTGNTANNNLATHGFYIAASSDNNTLDSNTANGNAGVGIGLDGSSNNKVTSCTVTHNQYGIFAFGSSNNIITSNIMNENDGRVDGDGIMISECTNTTIANNTMNNDPGDGIEFYQSSNSNVIGNTVINSGWGIRINYYCSNNVVSNNTVNDGVKGITLEEGHTVNNTVANNTTNNNSEDGIFVFDSTSNNIIIGNTASNNTNHGIHVNPPSWGNTIYLNNLVDNSDENVFSDDTVNAWHSQVALNYKYDVGTYGKGHLGNYYSDGNHTGSGGTGGTYIFPGLNGDDYQLLNTFDNYTLQAWWLNEDGNMYIGNPGKPGGSVSISGGGTHIWKSNHAAPADIIFPGSGSWTGQLAFTSAPANGHAFIIEIGSSSGGGDFTAGGPDASVTGDGGSASFTFVTDTSAFTLPAGKYLAFSMKSSDAEYGVWTGGAWSFVSSPENKAGYVLPVEGGPEIPSDYSLRQNYPNPFNPSTVINYQLPMISQVTLRVYDVLGREVKTLVRARQSPGEHSVTFSGAGLPSGMYFYVLNAGSYRETKKMLLLR